MHVGMVSVNCGVVSDTDRVNSQTHPPVGVRQSVTSVTSQSGKMEAGHCDCWLAGPHCTMVDVRY